jgi:hypothetical protein
VQEAVLYGLIDQVQHPSKLTVQAPSFLKHVEDEIVTDYDSREEED